ncbi:uncharacterized protein LOC123552827 [Mercenaria mercenaria]|uniref:uncharacterized protein LOC123552827 n=1 Tax=Mercenaria mercenaria TaxID=6596 RepID=UPI00234EBD71|nr:uncharacterized protein LOC123552827 [Mercenaria mercenaria]
MYGNDNLSREMYEQVDANKGGDYRGKYVPVLFDIDIHGLFRLKSKQQKGGGLKDQYVYIHECLKAFITTDEEEEDHDEERECQTGSGSGNNWMQYASAFMNTPINSGANMPSSGTGQGANPTFASTISKMVQEMTQAFGGGRGGNAGGRGGASGMQGMWGMGGSGDAPEAGSSGSMGGMMGNMMGGSGGGMGNMMGGFGGGMGNMMQGMMGGEGMGGMMGNMAGGFSSMGGF